MSRSVEMSDAKKKESNLPLAFFLSQTRNAFDILFNFLSRLLSALMHKLTRLSSHRRRGSSGSSGAAMCMSSG